MDLQWIAYEWNEGTIIALHLVHVTDRHQNTSQSWFHRREQHKTTKPNWRQLRRFNFQWYADFVAHENIISVFDNMPITEHATLWDFYIAIGYDYKRKRYLK